MNLNKTEALEIITAANPVYFASVDDSVLTVTKASVLSAALILINNHKPLIKRAALTLEGKKTRYRAPGDAFQIIGSDYGIEHLKNFMPGHSDYPKGIPSLNLDRTDEGLFIRLSCSVPGATQRMVGTMVGYDYKAQYKIDGDSVSDSNVPHTLQTLLEQASEVETARRHVTVAMHQKVGDGHKNKAVLSAQDAHSHLLKTFKQTAA